MEKCTSASMKGPRSRTVLLQPEATQNELTEEEKAHLRLWASATPAQRLAWLEEVQRIAYQSGALQKTQNIK